MTNLAIRATQRDADRAEEQRLEAVYAFDVLDTPHEEGFDGIARLIRNIFDVPVAVVSVIDAHRLWYKASEGLAETEAPREDAFCDVTIRQSRPLVVGDTLADARFSRNPSVVGAPHVRFYAGVPLRTREGYNIGTLCAMDYKPHDFGPKQLEILSDLARVAMAEFEMRQLVAVDALTGALSRRAVTDEGDRAMALARRHELEMSCLTLDFDGLKEITSRHGKAAGDAVLAGVAAKFRTVLRRTDHVGRLPGEQFAVILPNTNRDGAIGAAEKLRAAVAALSFEVDGVRVRTTATFGISTMDADTDDFEAMLARADTALHGAIENGRNCSVTWSGPEGVEHGARRRVLKAARLQPDGGGPAVAGTIRFLSGHGAGIDVSSSAGIPQRLTLSIGATGVDKSCRIVSRTEKHLEVEFC